MPASTETLRRYGEAVNSLARAYADLGPLITAAEDQTVAQDNRLDDAIDNYVLESRQLFDETVRSDPRAALASLGGDFRALAELGIAAEGPDLTAGKGPETGLGDFAADMALVLTAAGGPEPDQPQMVLAGAGDHASSAAPKLHVMVPWVRPSSARPPSRWSSCAYGSPRTISTRMTLPGCRTVSPASAGPWPDRLGGRASLSLTLAWLMCQQILPRPDRSMSASSGVVLVRQVTAVPTGRRPSPSNCAWLLEPDPRVQVDWDSLSLSAQTVEAALDAEHADSAVADLEALGLRVDPIVDRQILD